MQWRISHNNFIKRWNTSFFGYNFYGQLGLVHYYRVSLPTPIPNLPKITQISCGCNFAVCVDYQGFMWSFGENNSAQLGTESTTTKFNVPQKTRFLPFILSLVEHITLIITSDSNLWSCGRNSYGQLCLGNKDSQVSPQKTSFSYISKISAGYSHSLLQNDKGEIFSCGNNHGGQCGLGHYNHPQITPSLILNTPSNIVQFVCGCNHNLFLDSEGNVYSVGDNNFGSLGLGHNTKQNVLNKILNIPPIQKISCVRSSCYLIDFEGNLWTFGLNDYGQLGHGDKTNINTPKVINTVNYIRQISYGCCGHHLFVKNSQNQIFVTGNNGNRQLGTEDTKSLSILKEINSQYSTIWRDEFHTRAKSARK